MQYDIFISYASEDVSWAQKLETDLLAGGRTVFRDQTRLQVGRRWESQLQAALDDSQHMVVLWSSSAHASHWVTKEMARFERNTELDARRRLICINLEGQNAAYSTYQNIDLTTASAPGAAGIDQRLWGDAISRIRTAFDDDEDFERIETVVLAMNSDEANPAKRGGLTLKQLDTIERELGLSAADVQKRYAADRLEWRPYGGASTVKALLDELFDNVNAELARIMPGLRFGWRAADADFWADMTTQKPTDVAARVANAKLSLVIIDALSLQWPEIYQRTMLLRDNLKGSPSAWVFVPPFASEPKLLKYRDLVKGWSAPLLNAYFNPPLGRRDPFAPHLGVFCGDGAEIRRLLQTTISEYLARGERTPQHPYMKYQGRGH